MEMPSIFHLAIPCEDLVKAKEFYESLGCRVARQYSDRITINFFGHQLVCHLAPTEIDEVPVKYPRHFGMTILDRNVFTNIYQLAQNNLYPFVQDLQTQFPEKIEEHLTFCIHDPSNNVLEFKFYINSSMIY